MPKANQTEWADKPKTLKADVTLSVGRKASITIKFGVDSIDSKVRVGGVGRPTYYSRESVRMGGRLVRGKNGKPMTVPIEVKTTFIECTVGQKTVKARSCCKPPDHFTTKTGIYYAVRHLFRVDSETSRPMLSKSNRNVIMRALCPWLFAKPIKAKSKKEAA